MNNFTAPLKKILAENGYQFYRQGKGGHEIWRHPATGIKVTVDGKIKSRHLANTILRGAGLPKAF